MQAIPISNLSTAIASSPAAAAPHPFEPRPSSPFTAVFQSVLKGAGSNAKIPPAGKSQDSSREQAATAGTGSNLLNPLPQEIAAAALRTILPNLLNLPQPSLSPTISPAQAALANPDRASQPQPQALPNYFSAEATTGLGTITAQVSNTLRNFNAATAIPLNPLEPQPALMTSAAVSQDATALPIAAQDATPAPNVASNSNVPAAPGQAVAIAPAADSNPIPPASAVSATPDADANSLSGSPAQPQVVPTNGLNPPNGEVVQAIRADLNFLSVQALTPAGVGTKASVSVTPTPAANPVVQSNLQSLTAAGAVPKPFATVASPPGANLVVQTNPQPPANLPPTLPETLAHSAAKSAAMGASTIKLHENLQVPTADPAPFVPVTAVPGKTQSQDSSNASPGNESNPKPEPASNAHGNEKGFVQALVPAAPEPVSGHSAAADSAAVVAAAPVQTQPANSGAAPATTGGGGPQPSETLPGAPQNAPVVNAARIVDQQGQTEIRIEMQADSLGGVELRAHIAGDQIGASIAVEHHDVQVALATDLPALHNALAEKNLRVETLSVSHGSFSSLNERPGQDSGHRDFAHSSAKFAYLEQPVSPESFTDGPAEWAGPSASSAGLSVVA